MIKFLPSRAAALTALYEYLPRIPEYSKTRNYCRGERDTSLLSPFITHRLLTEQEVVSEALNHFDYKAIDKFIQEICWRTYWKGWLEQRPTLWDDYNNDVRKLAMIKELHQYQKAANGNTGIDCFDHWVRQLINDGYLPNHARMWFASIWIFTLELPWQLGAEFFMHHLLDGDIASNTLSWRWVAGLHTQGKHYLARASNIARYTENQFNPENLLNETAQPIASGKDYKPQIIQPLAKPTIQKRAALFICNEDLSPETSHLRNENFSVIFGGWAFSHYSSQVTQFKKLAISDALERASQHWQCPAVTLYENDWRQVIKHYNINQVVAMEPPVGPWSKTLRFIQNELANDIEVAFTRRQWDEQLWPHASAGFFRFNKQLPKAFKLLITS